MKDTDEIVSPADDALAPETEKSDEDIWNEIVAEDSASDPGGELDDPGDDLDDDLEGEDAPGNDATPVADELENDGKDGEAPELEPAEKLSRLREQYGKLEEENRRMKGRQPALDRKITSLTKELDRLKASQSKPETEEEKAARKQRIDAVQADYGDVTGPLLDELKRLEGRQEDGNAANAARVDAIEAELDTAEQEQQALFQEYHSDGLKVVQENRDVFKQWIDDQPRALRDMYERNNGRLVDGLAAAQVVTKFKEALLEADERVNNPNENRLQGKRARQLAGAQNAKSASRNSVTGDPGADSQDDEALWKYWERKDRKR